PGAHALLVAIPIAAACGGEEAAGGPGGGLPPFDCPAATALGDVAELAGARAGQETQPPGAQAPDPPLDPQTYYISGHIDGGELVELDLWEGYGAFAEGDKRVAPGTYRIDGDDRRALLCGICFYLLGDFDPLTGVADQVYLAIAGEVTIDSVSGELTGSAFDLAFAAIDLDHPEGAPLEGGCTATMTSIQFTAPLPAMP